MASQFSGQSQFGTNSFQRTQAGDPTRFGLVNGPRQAVKETVHPWLLEAQQNALGQMGLIGGRGYSGSGSGSSGTSGPGMDQYDALSNSLLGQIGQQGASQTQKINDAYDTSLDGSLSRLYDRGFGNSSLVETTTQQNTKDRQSSLTELQDSLLSQKIGVQQQVGLAGLAAQQQRYSQWQNQLLGGLFG